MKQNDAFKLLQTTSLPVTYSEWPQGHAPPLPYIVFLQSGIDRFLADNSVYHYKPVYSVELYSENKDVVSEKIIIDRLNAASVVWSKDYEERTDEGLYQSVFLI